MITLVGCRSLFHVPQNVITHFCTKSLFHVSQNLITLVGYRSLVHVCQNVITLIGWLEHCEQRKHTNLSFRRFIEGNQAV